MLSILAQERILGATLGAAFTAFVVSEQRRQIYQTIAANQPHHLHSQSQLTEPIFGKQFRSQVQLMWNKAVDETFAPAVAALSSRGR
ncbi:hypothetical protein Tsubulata_007980 [Turnera subulata]|uniref:Uncharacterized protein n=1 Tax=Turnera subulata TaxID=218843 RepID=A0A9Q0G820_9ROSI|nr:hypothetical protein Tsubulata_007980 [Turnera subulata]